MDGLEKEDGCDQPKGEGLVTLRVRRPESPRMVRMDSAVERLPSPHHKRERLPAIDHDAAKVSTAAKRISNVFAKALAGKAATKTSNDALALGAYASMFGSKLHRRSSPQKSAASGRPRLPVVELPTYRLEPLAVQRVRWTRLHIMVDSILTDFINRGRYDKRTAPRSACTIAQNIKMLAKELGYSKRYKIISIVDIGQNYGQEYLGASRTLWNNELDGQVTAYKKSSVAFAVASLYFIYTN